MIPMTLAEVAAAMGALVSADLDSAAVASGVSIDSRSTQAGEMFFALAGERVDGHQFVGQALDRGAVAAVVARAESASHRCLVVEDPLRALGNLASASRGRLASDVSVVGVTGSVGKTSTKDLVAAVLKADGPTVAATGSFNNEIGLPLTILRTDSATRHLVVELGARGPGHIAALCALARPTVGVVLNVGTAHLGEFGTREAIGIAKRELVESLPDDGTAVLNTADPIVADMARSTAAHVFSFGSPGADLSARAITLVEGRARFELDYHGQPAAEVHLRLVGAHHVANAVAAAAVGCVLGIDLAQSAQILSAATAQSKWRMEMHERRDGVTIVNDTYNASPESMRAALRALVALGEGGNRRTWAVLGNMAELGEQSDEIHYDVGRLAIELDVSRLLVIGERAAGIHAGGMSERPDGRGITTAADLDVAFEFLTAELLPGDVVLVKGARAAGLERLAAKLSGDFS